MVETYSYNMSFSHLLCYTFPGIFTAISILIILNFTFNGNIEIIEYQKIVLRDWWTFLAILTLIIFFGTIIGIVLDAIHHKIEGLLLIVLPKIPKYGIDLRQKENKIFKDIENNTVHFYYFIGFLPLERIQFLYENYYYFVECDFNLFLSFLFTAIVYKIFIFQQGCENIFYALIVISIFCLYSGITRFVEFRLRRIDLIKGYIDEKKRMVWGFYD